MKNFTLPLTLLFISAAASAQVGVNTTTPKSTMDISAKRDAGGVITDNTQILGLQAPRVTLAELTANTATYGINQQGSLIYITDVSAGTAIGQRVNIDAVGYYSFDGSLWQKIKLGDVNIYNNNGSLSAARTLTMAGFPLAFAGSEQSTSWSSVGALTQRGLAGSKRSSITLASDDNDGNSIASTVNVFQDPENTGQITVTGDSRGLSLGSTATTTAAPITFITSAGSTANGSEKMRITGDGNVGVATNAPNSTLVVEGSYEGAYKEVSANTALTVSDQYINVTGASSIQLTLPDATVANSFSGRVYSIKNTSDGTVTIAGNTASQLLRTASNSVANTITLTPGSSAKVIKNNFTTTANPLWEVFDQTTVSSNSGQFQIGETKTARVIVPATTFFTNSGTRNIMTGRTGATTTSRRSAYEILSGLNDTAQMAKFIVINGLRLDFMRSGLVANSSNISAKLFNTNATTTMYNLSGLSTVDANTGNGAAMNINSNHYSYNIDGNDDMSCADQGSIEYVNVMLTFPDGQWYNCTWHATRDATNFYFYMTAQRLN